jgi:hypothetical protein
VEAERERRPCEWLRKYADSARTGAVRSRRVSSCASRGVRLAMLWHRMCVGRGSSTREQENPRVRREVGIANPFGSIILLHDPRHPTILTLVDHSTAITTSHHGDYSFSHLPPRQPFPANSFIIHEISSSSSFSLHRSYSPREFTFRLFFLYSQGYPKVCPVSLNLLNTGDSFAGISSLTSCYLFSRTRDSIALT